MAVHAAGAICWREEDGKLLVAIIHRSRYKDWSWPKGKVDPGESLPEAAVREIREETGLRVRLGVPLGVQKYMLQNGAEKVVHYWAARVTNEALKKSTFKPDDEVEKIDWKTPEQARELLTYSHDGEILDKLLEYVSANKLRTKPFIVLRHAKATPRSEWSKGETSRPLLPQGVAQAKALVPLLAAYGAKNVVTSPWNRCKSTVMPYIKARKVRLIERGQLTEFGNANGPKRTEKTVERLLAEDKAVVLCSHRPALPTILDTIARHGTPGQEILVNEARALEPGSMLVVHMHTDKDGHRRIVDVETHSPILKA